MAKFEFYRFRFHFKALDALRFPAGKAANLLRGALGMLLRQTAPPQDYARLFRPGGALEHVPSGLYDSPRPFVLRAAHLDGRAVAAGDTFFYDLNIFEMRQSVLPHIRLAFRGLEDAGLGPGRARVELIRVEQLDLDDAPQTVEDLPLAPIVLDLEPGADPVDRIRARFVTPTELKATGKLAGRPEFPILFARVRDRLSSLSALYGRASMEADFRGLGERAAGVRMSHCQLEWVRVRRRSTRTGQVHPIGGFTGEAEYLGALSEFLPWLRAARWVGVGRQTVWGKGELLLIECSPAAP